MDYMIGDHMTTMCVATRVDYSFLLTGRRGWERTSLPDVLYSDVGKARVKLRIVKLLLLNIEACNDL